MQKSSQGWSTPRAVMCSKAAASEQRSRVAAISRWLCTSASGSIAGPVSSPLKRRAIGASEGLTPSNIFLSISARPLARESTNSSPGPTRERAPRGRCTRPSMRRSSSRCVRLLSIASSRVSAALCSAARCGLYMSKASRLCIGAASSTTTTKNGLTENGCAATTTISTRWTRVSRHFLELMPCEGRRGCRPGAINMVGHPLHGFATLSTLSDDALVVSTSQTEALRLRRR
mmetsp:Transcript_22283/g.62701  ORF Transcript_22283/g.62701 Transcript_22283/m.62701 type:complete len:231 (+) Transcript_22283:483-1175(+)